MVVGSGTLHIFPISYQLSLHPSPQGNEKDLFSFLAVEGSKEALAQSKGTANSHRALAPEGFCSFLYQLITLKQILTVENVGNCQLLFLSSGRTMPILAGLAKHFHQPFRHFAYETMGGKKRMRDLEASVQLQFHWPML